MTGAWGHLCICFAAAAPDELYSIYVINAC